MNMQIILSSTLVETWLSEAIWAMLHTKLRTDNAAKNIVKQMFLLYEYTSFGYMTKSGIARYCGRVIPILGYWILLEVPFLPENQN